MTRRMSKLDRILALVHLLAAPGEGLTLDDMADALGVNRRTAERMRDVIAQHFDLEEYQDDRRKRFKIRESLRRAFARPNAPEIAALEIEAHARAKEGAPQAEVLMTLLGKLKASYDAREKRSLDPDLDPLTRLQRFPFRPGPLLAVEPQSLHAAQQAIMLGHCLEFSYAADGASRGKQHCVVPYGLVHGPTTYLIGMIADRNDGPITFRMDRMEDATVSARAGCPPEDWDLDAWLERGIGPWRGDEHDVVLRVLPDAVEQAQAWRFHPKQTVTRDGGCLIVRFRSSGLWQIADHVFSWRGQVLVESPDDLRQEIVMRAHKLIENMQDTI